MKQVEDIVLKNLKNILPFESKYSIINSGNNEKERCRYGQRSGAGDVTRTHDLLITNQLHYRLCYTSEDDLITIPQTNDFVKRNFKIFLD